MRCFALAVLLIATTIGTAQIRWDQLTKVAETDVAIATLRDWQSKTEGEYKKGGFAVAAFSSWFVLPFESLKTLFPEQRFYAASWSERPAPGKEKEAVGLALGLEVTLVCGADGKLTKEIHHTGNYEEFGALLRDSKVSIRSADDAKLVWAAFCDLHQKHWQKQPALKIDDRTWHLGDVTIDRFHYYYEVKLDGDYRVAGAKLHADKIKKP